MNKKVENTNQKAEHRLIPDIIYWRNLDSADPPISLNDPSYQLKILAEGDSWFSIGALPSSNLLYELRFSKWTIILSLADPGDTVVHMSELASNRNLESVLAKKRFNYKWDAILLSGGGNDLFEALGEIILDKPAKSADPSMPESYIDTKIFTATLRAVQDGYKRIVELRDSKDSLSKNAPVIIHTFDYPTPRNSPANFLFFPVAGPWLYKIFADKNFTAGAELETRRRFVRRSRHQGKTVAAV